MNHCSEHAHFLGEIKDLRRDVSQTKGDVLVMKKDISWIRTDRQEQKDRYEARRKSRRDWIMITLVTFGLLITIIGTLYATSV